MTARQLKPLTTSGQMTKAAGRLDRVRVRGQVVDCRDAYNSSYRQHALYILSSAGVLRVTATPTSPLGTLPIGATVDIAARLTGLVDLSSDTFYGRNAQLLSSDPDPSGPA